MKNPSAAMLLSVSIVFIACWQQTSPAPRGDGTEEPSNLEESFSQFYSRADRVQAGYSFAFFADSQIYPEFWFTEGKFDGSKSIEYNVGLGNIPRLPRAVHPLQIQYDYDGEGAQTWQITRLFWQGKERSDLPVAFYVEDEFDYVFGGKVHLYFMEFAGELENQQDRDSKNDFVDPFCPPQRLRGLFVGQGGVLSVGPDGDADIDARYFDFGVTGKQIEQLVDLTYDPTNGAYSSGDLIYPRAQELDNW